MSAMLLALQVMRVGADNLGPGTMAVLAVNAALFYLDLDHVLPFSVEPYDVCIGAQAVWYGHQWSRLLSHAFVHASGMHLYYNLSSFLVKGRLLEPILGTVPFLWIIFTFALSTGGLMTLVSLLLDWYTPGSHYGATCAVGFSGVLFALNTVLPFVILQPEQSYVWGIRVPTRYLTFFELALISLLVPQASFLGHLCGIAVGWAFVSRRFDFIFRMPELLLLTPNAGGGGGGQYRPPQAGAAGGGAFYVGPDGVLRRR